MMPSIVMPPEEKTYLIERYREASIILEYGSGGSTELAASLPGKLVFSVESDRDWARRLQLKLELAQTQSPTIVFHVDIGATGPWGRPLHHDAWQRYPLYPLLIWDQPFFRSPDLVLIDGRFRIGCLAAVMLRARQPTVVLFDDYGVRPAYHEIESIIRPTKCIGRLARFDIEPGMITRENIVYLIHSLSITTLSDITEAAYQSETIF